MQLTLLLLFSLVVVSGLALVYAGLRQRRGLPWLATAHGLLALTAFGALLWHIINTATSKSTNFAAVMLFLALTGGGLLLALREKDTPPSMPLVAIHAVLALTGFSLLVAGSG